MRRPWRSKGFGKFDESKHRRQGGKFAPTGGGASAKPTPVSRVNPDLDAAMGMGPSSPAPSAPAAPTAAPAKPGKAPRAARKPSAKKLIAEASALATHHLQQSANADKAGDKDAASRFRVAGALFHAAAGAHEDGDHKKAAFLRQYATEHAAGKKGGAASSASPSAPVPDAQAAQVAEGRQWVRSKPSAPAPAAPPSGGDPFADYQPGSQNLRQHPAADPRPQMPHHQTQAAALEAARGVKAGDHASHAKAVSALDAHYAEGKKALQRMAQEKHGNSPKAKQAYARALGQWRQKVSAARRKIDEMAGRGPPPVPRKPGQGPPPLGDRGKVRPWVPMKTARPWLTKAVTLDLTLPAMHRRPWVSKGHDVSGEARDESGEWTAGSAAGHKENYQSLMAQAKEARKAAHAHAVSGAKEAHESANKANEAAYEANNQLAWESGNDDHDAYRELDELLSGYDPDATVGERMQHFKDVLTAAKSALSVELEFDDEDEAGTAKIQAENRGHLKAIIAHAKAAREHLKRHAAARREAKNIRSGDWLEKCLQRLVVKSRDASGHEHAADGRFGTVAGQHGGTDGGDKPAKAFRFERGPARHKKVADHVQRAIDQLKSAGVELPDMIQLDKLSSGNVHGWHDDNDAEIGHRVTINPNSWYWKDPEGNAKKLHEKGTFSTDSPTHIVIHEVGHSVHRRGYPRPGYDSMLVNFRFEGAEQKATVEREVSKYATTNGHEFVAEVFAGLVAGKEYGPFVMRTYKELHGPEVKKSESKSARPWAIKSRDATRAT